MIWKIVPSYPSLEASDAGLVRITPYTGAMPNGGFRTYGGKAMTGVWAGSRYIIRIHLVGKSLKVARLVCEAFHGPAPEGKPYVLHIDENARNNKPDNLMWGTQKENLNAPGFLAYCRGRIGEKSSRFKGRHL